MLPSILERKFFAVESRFLRILSIVSSYVKSKCQALAALKNVFPKEKFHQPWGNQHGQCKKLNYFQRSVECYAVEPHRTATALIQPPCYYAHFILNQTKDQSVSYFLV